MTDDDPPIDPEYIPDGMVCVEGGTLVGRETVEDPDRIVVDPLQDDDSDDDDPDDPDDVSDRMDAIMSADPVGVDDDPDDDLSDSLTDDPDVDADPVDDDQRDDRDDGLQGPDIVSPVVHEAGAKLLFADERDGLSPYHALAADPVDRILDYQGRDDPLVEDMLGDDWIVSPGESVYWESAIAAEGEDYDRYREYQLKLVAKDDPNNARYILLQFRPSLPDATHAETGDPIQSLPDDLPYGIRVQVRSNYVDPGNYVDAIQQVAKALDLRPDYFDESKLHDWSRIHRYARYVRIQRSVSEDRIVGPGGIVYRLADFGRSTRGRGSLKWDNEEIMGHYLATTMDRETWSKLIPGRLRDARLKSYHMANPENQAGSTTSHPKLEVQLAGAGDDDRGVDPVDLDDLDRLRREFDEILLNSLSWSGVGVETGSPAMIADDYFDPADPVDHELELVDDPIDDVADAERDLATTQILTADLSDDQRDVAESIADRGRAHYETIADDAGVGTSTVYRTLDKLDAVIRRSDGIIEYVDEVVRDEIDSLFATVANAADYVDNRLAEVGSGDDPLQDLDGGPFADWLRAYGGSIRDLDPRESPGSGDWIEIDLSLGEWSRSEIRRILRAGATAARQESANALARLCRTTVRYRDRDDGRRRLIAAASHGGTIKAGGYPVDGPRAPP